MYYPALSLENAPHTIVLANGDFPEHPLALSLIDAWINDMDGQWRMVCCDGAVNKLSAYTSHLPDAVVGDLDSITPLLKERLVERVVHTPNQDANDLTKAMHYVHDHYKTGEVIILGSSGGREDHLIANVFLMTGYASLVKDLVMLTDRGYFRLISEASSLEVEIGQQISVFCPHGDPISLDGVHWPLDNARLGELWAGTLNRADQSVVHVRTSVPCLIYISLVDRR